MEDILCRGVLVLVIVVDGGEKTRLSISDVMALVSLFVGRKGQCCAVPCTVISIVSLLKR